MHGRAISAFTRVLNALSPAMTSSADAAEAPGRVGQAPAPAAGDAQASAGLHAGFAVLGHDRGLQHHRHVLLELRVGYRTRRPLVRAEHRRQVASDITVQEVVAD